MAAKDRTFPFKLGAFDCLILNDSVSPLDLDFLFPDIDEGRMEELLSRYNIPGGGMMNVMCLFLRTGENNILIDTGWGPRRTEGLGDLVAILQENGIKTEEIDTVIISHGHPDHIGGNTDGKGEARFPNAQYFMYRKEWDFWSSIPETRQVEEKVDSSMRKYARKNLMPIQGRLHLVNCETEMLPGIKFNYAPGHTLHHCMLEISSGDERLIYVSDVIHHPVQVPFPDLCVLGDFDPEQAVKTRSRFISKFSESNTLLFICHFPFPGLGRIVKRDGVALWDPL